MPEESLWFIMSIIRATLSSDINSKLSSNVSQLLWRGPHHRMQYHKYVRTYTYVRQNSAEERLTTRYKKENSDRYGAGLIARARKHSSSRSVVSRD